MLDAAGSHTRRSAVSKSSGTRTAAVGFGAAGFTDDSFAVAAGFTIDGFAEIAGLCGTRGFDFALFGMSRTHASSSHSDARHVRRRGVNGGMEAVSDSASYRPKGEDPMSGS